MVLLFVFMKFIKPANSFVLQNIYLILPGRKPDRKSHPFSK